MGLDADFSASATVDLKTWFGESISYTPAGRTAATETAIVERLPGMEDRDETGAFTIEEAVILMAPTATGGAARAIGDTLTLDGKTFGVANVTGAGGSGLSELRVVAVEKTRAERQDAVMKRRR